MDEQPIADFRARFPDLPTCTLLTTTADTTGIFSVTAPR